jgi:hypothetical protein
MENYNHLLNYIADNKADPEVTSEFDNILTLIGSHIERIPEDKLRETTKKQSLNQFRIEEMLEAYSKTKLYKLEGYFNLSSSFMEPWNDERLLSRLRRLLIIIDMCHELVSVDDAVMSDLRNNDTETYEKLMHSRRIYMKGRKFLGEYFQ